MKLSYRIEREDHSAFQWHHFWRSATMWRNYSVVLLLGIMLVSYTLYERGLDFQTVATSLAGYIMLMIVVFAVSTYFTITSAIKRQIPPGDNNGVVGDHCLVIDEAEISEQAGPVQTKVRWSAIRKVSVGEDHVFIYFAPAQAFIVPKRAFTNESDFHRFVRDCISRLPENVLSSRLGQTSRQ